MLGRVVAVTPAIDGLATPNTAFARRDPQARPIIRVY